MAGSVASTSSMIDYSIRPLVSRPTPWSQVLQELLWNILKFQVSVGNQDGGQLQKSVNPAARLRKMGRGSNQQSFEVS